MRKLKEIEKKYGLDFGTAKGMTLHRYLKKIGFPNLAKLLLPLKKKKGAVK